MSHAERCPVCYGTGKYDNLICHGCNGKGWVEVSDGNGWYPWTITWEDQRDWKYNPVMISVW